MDPHWLTKDNVLLNRIYEDRLMAPLTTVKMVKTLIQMSSSLERKVEEVKINAPFLFICSEKDRLTPISHAMKFFERLNCKEKKFSFHETALHEILFDVERDQMISQCIDFITAQLPNSAPFGSLKRVPQQDSDQDQRVPGGESDPGRPYHHSAHRHLDS